MDTDKILRVAIVMGSIFSLVASLFMGSINVATAQLLTHMTLQKAKVYDIDWQEVDAIVHGTINPELVVTNSNATTIEGRIVSNNHTLYNYNDESRIMAIFGYDQIGKESSQPVLSTPVSGTFVIPVSQEYADADYVRLQVNSNSFFLVPAEPSNYTTTETTPLINETTTVTAVTSDNRNSTITTDRLSTVTTTTSVATNSTSIVTNILVNKTSVVTTITSTELPDDEDYVAPLDSETYNVSSTSSWSSNSTYYSPTKTTITKLSRAVTNQTHAVDTTTETTVVITDSMAAGENAVTEGHTSVRDHDGQTFKIDTYRIMFGGFEEIETYQGFIPVSLESIVTVHRLGGLNEGS